MTPLPIDELLPLVQHAVRERKAAVVVAAPGAGKSTRIPPAVLACLAPDAGEVLVLEPRRLAARLLAERVAAERGEPVGRTVGYTMRFEHRASDATRVRFVTEGVLARRLAHDPTLRGVAAVILDELHERHLDTDLCLAAVAALRRGARPDLVVVAMSATMDPGPVARLLDSDGAGPVPVLTSEGRAFPVEVEHLPSAPTAPLEQLVAQAVARVAREEAAGHTLVFLPGAREIRRAHEACRGVAARHGLEVMPLHGTLSRAEQDRAVGPSSRRKVILATNVAETSLTIDGVTAVIDSGLVRAASVSSRGVPTLRVVPTSKASATQRAGRAGRTAPGRALRLYTRGSFDERPELTPPEILGADLSGLGLTLAGMGLGWAALPWLDAPPASATAAASALLVELMAITKEGVLTGIGKRMLELPLSPRLARVLVEADSLGVGERGAALVAALSEGSPLGRDAARAATDSDALAWLEAYEEARERDFDPSHARANGLDLPTLHAIDRARAPLAPKRAPAARRAAPRSRQEEDVALRKAVLAGYLDRLGRLRSPQASTGRAKREVVLASGGTAAVDEHASSCAADLVVVLELEHRVEGRTSMPRAEALSGVELEWLLFEHTDRVSEERELSFDPRTGNAHELERLRWDRLVLDETRRRVSDPARVSEAIARHVAEQPPEALLRAEPIARLGLRLAFLRARMPELDLPDPSPAFWAEHVASAVSQATKLSDVDPSAVAALALASLGNGAKVVEREAPDSLTLPGGRRVAVEYSHDAPPSISSRLQDFFGLAQGPTIAGGRVPVVLELLAPNQRAVQVTTDLAGFWERHYPAIAKELRRKYPRHPFPDDPLHASPPPPRGRR